MSDTKTAPDWRSITLAIVALVGSAGGGLGLGAQLTSASDEPEVVAYRLGRMESAVETLTEEVRSLEGRTAERWTRTNHDRYASETEERRASEVRAIDSRLRVLESRMLQVQPH